MVTGGRGGKCSEIRYHVGQLTRVKRKTIFYKDNLISYPRLSRLGRVTTAFVT